jgi:hypothetical protein
MEPVTLTLLPVGTKKKNENRNVSYHPNKKNKWRCCIIRKKKIIFSAFYSTQEEAIRGRDAVLDILEQERLSSPDLSRPLFKYNL